MQRHGSIIGLDPKKIEEYKRLHSAVWPEVLTLIRQFNLRNYSIYLRHIDGKPYLFSYYEYVGNDYAADMARMAADPTTQEWWKLCKPCQVPLPDREPGQWWAEAEEVFHTD